MAELGAVDWPPAPIRTDRLVLRGSAARDRSAILELFANPEVGVYIGGPRDRDELERVLPDVPGRRPGFFVVELDGATIGTVTLDRRDIDEARPDAGRISLGYLFLPRAWGRGYAREACEAALGWLGRALPGEPVLLCTQTANARSLRLAATLGFTEVDRFLEYGAEQWLGEYTADVPGRRPT